MAVSFRGISKVLSTAIEDSGLIKDMESLGMKSKEINSVLRRANKDWGSLDDTSASDYVAGMRSLLRGNVDYRNGYGGLFKGTKVESAIANLRAPTKFQKALKERGLPAEKGTPEWQFNSIENSSTRGKTRSFTPESSAAPPSPRVEPTPISTPTPPAAQTGQQLDPATLKSIQRHNNKVNRTKNPGSQYTKEMAEQSAYERELHAATQSHNAKESNKAWKERRNASLAEEMAAGREKARASAEATQAAETKAQMESFLNGETPLTSSPSKAPSISHAAFTDEEVAAAKEAYEAGTLKGRIKTAYGKVKSSINNFVERHRDHPAEYNEYQKRTIGSLEGYEYPKAPEGKIKFGDTAAAHQKSVYQDTRNFSQELANVKNDEEMNKLFESRGIKNITATDEGAARKALEQFQKNATEAGPGFGDYMEAYHGHAAIAVGTVGMGAIKAFDNGGSRTNAQLYGMG